MSATIVDARGMRCPWPALRAARAMRESAAIVLLADDPAAATELAALAADRGWSFDRIDGEFHLKRIDRGEIG